MRNLHTLDLYRAAETELKMFGFHGNERNGLFILPSPTDGEPLRIIASSGGGWEHLSVSRETNRCPNWPEMEWVKRQFFEEHECAMQLHPPQADYINGAWPGGASQYTLHIWRPLNVDIPRPPQWMIGANSKAEADKLRAEAHKLIEEGKV